MGAFLKQLLGDSYKEDLKHDELEALLEPKYNALVKERDAFKVASDKNSSEASEYKKKYQEKLTDAEKKQLEYDELLKKVSSYEREKTIAEQKANYIALGYSDELAQESAVALLDKDFATVMKNQKLVNEKLVEEANKKKLANTPTPPNPQNNDTITKEQFAKMGYDERVKLYNEDRATYEQLTKK